MHSLSAYTIRIHDALLPGPMGERYHVLDNVRSHDTLDFIEGFFSSLIKTMHDDKDNKKTVQTTQAKRNGRSVYGWVDFGEYGLPGHIVSIRDGSRKYTKSQEDSDVRSLYFNISIPSGSKMGVALFHTAGGRGMKSFFYETFKEYVKSMVALNVQMKPLTHEKTVQEWLDKSDVKEIRLGRYSIPDHGSDIADKLGAERVELVLKPKRGRGFGNIRALRNPVDGSNKTYVELLSDMSVDVKAVVESGGRKKILSLRGGEPIAAVELDEPDVTMIDGAPEPNSLHSYASGLMREFTAKVRR